MKMLSFAIGLAIVLFSSVCLNGRRVLAADPTSVWNDPNGGLFSDSANWMPEEVPTVDNDARFNLGAGPTGYTVTLDANEINSGLFVWDDVLTLDLAGFTYTLTDVGDDHPGPDGSVRVGYYSVDVADLTVTGGTLDSIIAILGQDSGSDGTVTITGAGSNWTNSFRLFVGDFGTGTLNVENGGTVSSSDSYIADEGGSNGTVSVSGAGSIWTTSSSLNVGNSGTGTLNVENGGTVYSSVGEIGFIGGSTGIATVTGAGSNWNNSGSFTVGTYGTGTLSVENGGMVSNTNGVIGSQAGSTGTVTITGVGSTWTNSNSLQVGPFGNGTLNVENGGMVSSTSGLIGFDSGVTGMVTVTGVGSTWTNSSSLQVGVSGTGALDVLDGGAVSVGSTLDIGNLGTLNLDGGTITTRSFENTSGGTLNFNDGTLTVDGGTFAPASGTVIINGGSAPNDLATLRLIDGASANVTAHWIIGDTNDGAMVVDGGESALTLGGSLADVHVGHDGGDGTLTISDGAEVVVPDDVTVGRAIGSTGTVVIDGTNSLLDVTDVLAAGANGGTANIQITDGGTVTSTSSFIATDAGSTGSVTVDGVGSKWTENFRLRVGNGGTGTLDITGGGVVENTDHGYIAPDPGSDGTVTVDGAGSTWTNHKSLFVGGGGSQAFGTGSLSIANGGSLTVTDELKVWNTGTVTFNGGTIETGQLEVDDPSDFVWTGGTLKVTDQTILIDSQLFDPQWTIALGASATIDNQKQLEVLNNSIVVGADNSGVLSITDGKVTTRSMTLARNAGSSGNVTVDGSTAELEIDQLNFLVGNHGDAVMDVLNGGTVIVAGEFRIAEAFDGTGTLTVAGAGSSLMAVTDLAVGGNIDQDGGAGTLTVDNGGAVTVADTLKVWSGNTVNFTGGSITTGTLEVDDQNFDDNWTAGTLEITSGTYSVDSTAEFPGPFGDLLVLDTGHHLDLSDLGSSNLYVGRKGTGSVTVQGGATLHVARNLVLGNKTNSNGTFTVDGIGSSVTVDTILRVGDNNQASFTVQNGATATLESIEIGRFTGSSGSMTVSDPNSMVDVTTDVYVGGTSTTAGATGSLTVENDAALDVIGTVKLYGGGTLTIDGGTMTTGALDADAGTLNFFDGTIEVNNGEFSLPATTPNLAVIDGQYPSDLPTVLITGVGSSLSTEDAFADLTIGAVNKARVDVTLGAMLRVQDAANLNGLIVGDAGEGILNLNSDATGFTASVLIGVQTGSMGTVNVSGTDSAGGGSTSHIGIEGTGVLLIEDGASFGSQNGIIGRLVGGTGTVTVRGIGTDLIPSTWSIAETGGPPMGGSLIIGKAGAGILNIEAGGLVTTDSNFSNEEIIIAELPGSTGTVTVTGEGSAWTNTNNLYVGGSSSSLGGTGILKVENGATVSAGNLLKIWNTGTVNLNSGGTLETDVFDHTAGGTFNFTGGTLAVDSFQGNLTQDGGTLVVGSSQGITAVTQDYTMNAGTLEIEIFDSASGSPVAGVDFDQLVADTVNLADTLDLVIDAGYMPTLGDMFPIVTATGGVSGMFSSVNNVYLSGGFTFDVIYNANDVTLEVIAALLGDFDLDGHVDGDDLTNSLIGWEAGFGTGFDGGDFLDWQRQFGSGVGSLAPSQAVPEPTSLLLAAFGLLTLSTRRKSG